jgi:serine acetyltransferase
MKLAVRQTNSAHFLGLTTRASLKNFIKNKWHVFLQMEIKEQAQG